jgi:hypothetical protein
MVYLLKMVIFYSYVKLPEGKNHHFELTNAPGCHEIIPASLTLGFSGSDASRVSPTSV